MQFSEIKGKLGFGLMRLPMIGEEVDIEQTAQMADLFLKSGFNYFDTAYGYIGGKSERAVKQVLTERHPRESFLVATKLPAWAGPKTKDEAEQMFWTSLARTGLSYFDFYLLHNLGGERTAAFDTFGIWDFLAEQKKQGRIRHLGFSMHATAEELDQVLSAHPETEFVQLQINYADWDDPTVQSGKCHEVALRHNVPVIVMEPVKGGLLADLPESVAQHLPGGASQASWAMRYAAGLPGVAVVLSGMSTLDQMADNLSYMRRFEALDDAEQTCVDGARQALRSIERIPCTDCKYCEKGCPEGIAIPGAFQAMNSLLVYGNKQRAQGDYAWQTKGRGKASQCIECGQCEAACPQRIAIIEQLKRVAGALE